MEPHELPSSFFLFQGVPPDVKSSLRSKYPGILRSYREKEIVSSPNVFRREVGVIIAGSCRVIRERAEGDLDPLPMNLLGPGDSFGLLTVLTEESSLPTTVIAKAKTEILFFTEQEILGMMKESFDVALNVSRFLAGRVVFLNHKIAPFSGKCAEERLATYLAEKHARGGNEFAFSPATAARELNLGRASLYRALNALIEKGIIRFESKTITIIHPNQLKGNLQK